MRAQDPPCASHVHSMCTAYARCVHGICTACKGTAHSVQVLRKVVYAWYMRDTCIVRAWYMQVLLKAGHAAFHHALTVHGSWANRSAAPRRALVINLFAHGACICICYACARYMHVHDPPSRAADHAHSIPYTIACLLP